MYILGIHTGHDASACIFDGFKLLSFVKEERCTRIKCDGIKIPINSIQECLKIANISIDDIEVIALSRAHFPVSIYKQTSKKIKDTFRKIINSDKKRILAQEMNFLKIKEEESVLDLEKLKELIGVNNKCKVSFTNHHLSHVLGSFYFSTWPNKSLYLSADGGGDGAFYSAYYFDGKSLNCLYGSDETIMHHQKGESSIGQAYSIVTELLGFKRNRHEGKITGLAAYGNGLFADEILNKFVINDDYSISSKFKSYDELKIYLESLYKKSDDKEMASSIQISTEKLIVKWINKIKKDFDIKYIGLSGGVFSNVKLNQEVSLIDGIDEIFILPPMGDEGLPIGNTIDFLVNEYGLEKVIDNRQLMNIPYYGYSYDLLRIKEDANLNEFYIYDKNDYIQQAAKLLEDNIGAVFYEGMEMGPRALGARSIIASPKNRDINNSLNKRLDRTDFMPFAPYVRDIDAEKVYEINGRNRYASKFMTITTNVKEEYKDLISAVIHVDNTARPQIISRSDNFLYYDVLTEFFNYTGIPTLVNTSFNAHEEPIINKPLEAFNALKENRIDFLIFDGFLVFNDKNLYRKIS